MANLQHANHDPHHQQQHRQQRTVLVTGGAGFIGSYLIDSLVRNGDKVVVVDNLSTGKRANIERINTEQAGAGRITFIEATVSKAIEQLDPGQFTCIYHLAAAVGVRLVIEQPIHTIQTNVHETAAILDFASAAGTPIFIASTSEVYGKGAKSPFAEDDDVVYGPTIYARWSYAASKAIDEYLALAHHRERDLPVRIVRFFNTVGPRQIGEYGMVLPRFVEAALHNQPLIVHGDGKQTRCFCDVRDVVNVLPRIMEEPETAGRVMNLGNDDPIEIGQLAELVVNTLGSQSAIEYVAYDRAFGSGFDDLRHRRPDLTRLRTLVGFQPQISLEQTIRDIAATMQDRDDDRSEPETGAATITTSARGDSTAS